MILFCVLQNPLKLHMLSYHLCTIRSAIMTLHWMSTVYIVNYDEHNSDVKTNKKTILLSYFQYLWTDSFKKRLNKVVCKCLPWPSAPAVMQYLQLHKGRSHGGDINVVCDMGDVPLSGPRNTSPQPFTHSDATALAQCQLGLAPVPPPVTLNG